MATRIHEFNLEFDMDYLSMPIIVKVDVTVSHWTLPERRWGENAHPAENEWRITDVMGYYERYHEDGDYDIIAFKRHHVPDLIMERIESEIEKKMSDL